MKNLSVLSKNVYLALLAGVGTIAALFAMASTSSCSAFWFYQPKMPASLIKED